VRTFALQCLLWTPLVFAACGLLVEIPDDSGIACCPSSPDQVLCEEQVPHISFDFAVDRLSVQSLFSIRDAAGELAGEYRWAGQTVSFHARDGFVPGRRYTFTFVGIYYDRRGIGYTTNRIVPFYFRLRDDPAPYVLHSEPESGGTISCGQPIRIRFSEPIDPASLTKGFRVQPDTPVTTNWESGASELVVTPMEEWNACQCYTIRLGEELLDVTGIPLGEPRELVFWVQEDDQPPRLLSIQPALNLPARIYPAASYTINDPVGLTDVLYIRFSEAMDTRSTGEALILQPSTATENIWIDAASLIVAPAGEFGAGTNYLLDFTALATDPAGNSIQTGEPIRFVTVRGEITVVTELLQDGVSLDAGDYSTATAIQIRPYPIATTADYELLFHFTGAEFDSDVEKYAVQEAISLLCVFPDSRVRNPVVTGYSWLGNSTLSVTFSELQPSTQTRRIYYLLDIRGGLGGVATDEGYRLQRDLAQLLVTAVE
jgi:hypothetical protein